MISLIAAVSRNGVIGANGKLPWKCPSDLRHFSRTTRGHTVVMGRSTYESMPQPLPERKSVVLSRSQAPSTLPSDVIWVNSFPDDLLVSNEEVFVVGGSSLYKEFLERSAGSKSVFCDRLYITRILADVDGDTLFPSINDSEWRADDDNPRVIQGDLDEYPMQFFTYRRW